MNEKTKAIIRLVVQAVLLFNMALTLAGKNPLAVDESALTDWLTTTVTAISSIWIWWKNNNVTDAACETQGLLDISKGKTMSNLEEEDLVYDDEEEEV